MTAVPTPIYEDSPLWDCATMGNGICGPGALPEQPLYMTPLPYMIGMVCLWIIAASVLALAPGAREQVGRGLWWVALLWPITIPLGVLLAYWEWVRECRQDAVRQDVVAHDRRTRTAISKWV